MNASRFLVSCLLLGIGTTNSAEAIGFKPFEIPIQALLAPPAFYDDNDEIRLVAFGKISNCQVLSKTRVENLTPTHFKIIQTAYAEKPTPDGAPCGKADSSFMTEVSLGKLKAGDYHFTFLLPSQEPGFGYLHVNSAKSAEVDDQPYAVITDFTAPNRLDEGQEIQVTLNGYLKDSCTKLESVTYELIGETYVIKPVVKLEPNTFCAEVITPFSYPLKLGKAITGIFLIQVRSSAGRSLSHVLEVTRI